MRGFNNNTNPISPTPSKAGGIKISLHGKSNREIGANTTLIIINDSLHARASLKKYHPREKKNIDHVIE